MALSSLQLGAVCVVAFVFVQYISAYLASPLKKIPGPLLAKYSNLWRFWNHYSQTHIETQKELHKRYGSTVRLGPNTVSLADPSLVKTIYSTRGNFIKVSNTHQYTVSQWNSTLMIFIE
jgi:hypothetical protein